MLLVLFLQNKEENQIVKNQTKGVMEKLGREQHEILNKNKDLKKLVDSLDLKVKQSDKEIDTDKQHIQKLQVRLKFSFF